MAPSTELPGNIFYYVIVVGFISFFIAAVAVRLVHFRGGPRYLPFDDIWHRVRDVFVYMIGQRKFYNRILWYSGILHPLIFWGFLTLQIRSINFLLDGFHEDASLQSLLKGVYTGYRPVMDLFNVLVIVGVGMAAIQRFFWRPKRMTLNIDGWIILGLIFFLMVTDVLTNSFQIALHRQGADYWSFWAFGMANLWDAVGLHGSAAEALHTAFWYCHALDFFAFLIFLPFSKHSHVLSVVFNVFSRSGRPSGVLQPINVDAVMERMEKGEEGVTFGVGRAHDFSWKQKLDFYTCTECGRCQSNCPANLTGKELSPKAIMGDLRHVIEPQVQPLTPFGIRLHAQQAATRNGGAPSDSAIEGVGFNPIWDCVTCGACQEACPVLIEHVPTIIDMRRYLVMDEANMPETAQATLAQLEQRGHPWRGTPFTRTSWMEGMDIPMFTGEQEYLFWVGCTGALVDRNIPITQALARLLIEAKVSFGVLGEEETCSGDPARRLGNEYLFQMQAQQTIEVWKSKGVQKVITNCPHCFNTFKNEYPQFDGNFEVVHHSDFLAQLLKEGRLKPTDGIAQKITYHDSCYLARHNRMTQPPRDVIAALPNAENVEMPRSHRTTFCCGAGGGHAWVEESMGQHINNARTEEAVSTGADVIATACPFCVQMFEDGIPAVQPEEEGRMRTMDLAELLEVAVLGAPAKAAAPDTASEAESA